MVSSSNTESNLILTNTNNVILYATAAETLNHKFQEAWFGDRDDCWSEVQEDLQIIMVGPYDWHQDEYLVSEVNLYVPFYFRNYPVELTQPCD